MKDLVIEPLKRVGEIILLEKRIFNKSNELLDSSFLDFEYDEGDRILSIIIREKIQCKYNILLYGISIFQVTLDDLIKELSKKYICKFDGSGYEYYFPELNIIIHRDIENSNTKTSSSSIATIIVSATNFDNYISDKLLDWEEGLICESVYKNLNVKYTTPTQSDLEKIVKKYNL